MKNWAKTDTTTPKAPANKINQQALTTYNHKLTTQRTSYRKENQLNEPTNSNWDH
jgi:hypothetical protein